MKKGIEELIEKNRKTLSPDQIKQEIIKTLNKPISIIDLANKFNKPPKIIEIILEELKKEKFNIIQENGTVELSTKIKEGGKHIINLRAFDNKLYKIGFTGDNHLCSKWERLDVLNALYDIYEQEGITEVYNTGNWIEGEARFNKYEIHTVGMTPQVEYFIKNYPQRKGITTYFIAGDDHEGWYVQREKMNIGEYAQMKAQKEGRNDLIYIGYVEADVILQAKKGNSIMKVMHPGGGSAYALSYSPQKIVESFSGGEKPNILLLGHYHKFDFICYRNIYTIQTGTTCDQTTFMRKLKIQAHVGGGILEFMQSQDGAISRAKVEWIGFYDRPYYKRNGYYQNEGVTYGKR